MIDEKVGYVESLNWELRDLTETRDYAIVTDDKLEVAEMVACFDADWEHAEFKPHPDSNLIWCPIHGRPRVAHFIDNAKQSLWVQNERYQDTVIIERLVRAVERGVKIHVLARKPHSLKPDKLIEGVGGILVPLDDHRSVLDLMSVLRIPIVLVAGSYVGTMSHTLTALEVLVRRNLNVAAVVVSESEKSAATLEDTVTTLRGFADSIDVVGIPRLAPGASDDAAFARIAELI